MYPPAMSRHIMTIMAEKFPIYNSAMRRRLTMLAEVQFAVDEVVAEAVARVDGVVILVVITLVKLVITLKPYLMIAKRQNPIMCLLPMTREMGNCSYQEKDQRHCQTHGCSLIAVPLSTSSRPLFYYMGYTKCPTLYGCSAMQESPYLTGWVILGITHNQCGTTWMAG